MIEREYKYRLSKRAYRKIRKNYKSAPTKKLTNTYIETVPPQLIESGVGLRVRSVDLKYFVTLKHGGSKSKNGWSERQEIETKISKRLADSILSGKATVSDLPSPLPRVIDQPGLRLKKLGSLRTERTMILYQGLLFELDCSRYFQKIECELEVEGINPKALKRCLTTFLKENGVEGRPENRSKLQRFMKALASRK